MNLRARAALSEVLTSLAVLGTEEKATVLRLAADAYGLTQAAEVSRIDAIVAKLVNDPNSKVSKSLQQNVCAGRIRD